MSDDVDPIEQIVAEILATPKYGSVCPDTVRRIAVQEWSRRAADQGSARKARQRAAKATRARLHQVHGAYGSRVDYARAAQELEAAYAAGTDEAIRGACRRLLALHASTRERLPILDRFYAALWAHTGGPPRSLLDLACGLNPLTLPWMGLPDGATYTAYDIDVERVDFLRHCLFLRGAAAQVRLQDVLCDPPAERADVALLLKSSTCLERQRKGATLALLDALPVAHVVVTFPVRSLGQRDKGMRQHYRGAFADVVSAREWPVTELTFESELAFVVRKGEGTG
jgi:16S rRNA (guanine(1405)-N(7))-methyltransferase